MTRLLALAAFVLFGFSASAQHPDQTDMKIDPVWRAYCEKRDYPLVNGIDMLKKVSETDNEVTFTFRSFVAACKDKKLTVYSVNPEMVYVGMAKSGGFLGSGGVELQYDALPLETYVTVTFNKRKAFKDDRIQRKYMMGYYPWGAFQSYFPWTVLLTKNAAGTATLKIN